MRRVGVLLIFGLGASLAMFGGIPATPEIDPGSCAGAFALVTGTLLVLGGRRKK